MFALATATAHAEPTARVVLADSDPELLRAVTTTLAPWRLEVIVDDLPPKTTGEAEARAKVRDARFVVWRRDGDLVVFDRDRGAAEHRDGKQGALDVPSAMAAALTVKTLMRLPPPAEWNRVDVAPLTRDGFGARLQTVITSRVARGSSTELGGRVAAALLARPSARRGLRIGIAGELGTGASIENQGFKGTWSDWSVLAIGSWTQERGRMELEPYAAAGIARSTFDGTENGMTRREKSTLASLRVGFAVRWRFGAWTVGPAVELDAFLGTPTYDKLQGNGEVFRVPAFAVALGLLGAIDFGR